MEIRLKDANLNDIEAMNTLMRLSKSHWGYDASFLDEFMNKLRITQKDFEQNITTKLVYVKDELIGFFSFNMKDNMWLLDTLFLHPNYIGQGLGLKLWKICCETAHKLGSDEFMVESDPNAVGFYLKMGCEKIGTRLTAMNRQVPVLKYKHRE